MHEIVSEDKTERLLESNCTKIGEHLYIRKGTGIDIEPEIDGDIQVVFSMGGRGTRLKHITNDKYSKHLIKVHGKPLSRYALEMWSENGFKNFLILVDDTYIGDSVREYYKNGDEIGAVINYSIEHSKLGSGGAIKYAKDHGLITKAYINHYPDDIIINYPNFAHDFVRVFLSAIKSGYQCVVLCVPGKLYPYGVVMDKDGKVTDFIEKPFIAMDTNTGIYGMNTDAFGLIDGIEPDKEVKIERTVMKGIAKSDKMLKVLIPTEYWIPVNDEPNLNKFREILG